MISDSHRFVFVHIPRTGGTSVETALADVARTPVGFTVHDNTVLPDKHAKATGLRASLGQAWDDYLTFATVRDPWERMLSDHTFFRHVGPALYDQFSPLERALTDSARTLDLTAWLVEHVDILDMCQSTYLCDDDGELIVDVVMRLETLEADFAAVCQRLGLRRSLPRVNATSHPSVRDSYTPRGRDLVASVCAPDLERFGYRFDGAVA